MQFTISLLNLNWFKLHAVCQSLQDAKVQNLHLDIMDGHFGPTISFGAAISKQLKTTFPTFQLSGHFMTKLPVQQTWTTYLAPFSHLDSFIVHYEAVTAKQRQAFFEWGKTNQKAIGLAIDLTTSWTKIKPYLADIQYLLVMLVPLGKGGQQMETHGLINLKACLKYCQSRQLNVKLIADGGINLATITSLPRSLDYAVLGSYCWKGQGVAEQLAKINAKLNFAQ